MNNGTNILTVDEILNRLPNVGVKKRKQLLSKLIKKFGGKPIKHILDPSDGEVEWGGSMRWECADSQIFGFRKSEWYNLSTKEGGENFVSITGNFPEEIIKKILEILN